MWSGQEVSPLPSEFQEARQSKVLSIPFEIATVLPRASARMYWCRYHPEIHLSALNKNETNITKCQKTHLHTSCSRAENAILPGEATSPKSVSKWFKWYLNASSSWLVHRATPFTSVKSALLPPTLQKISPLCHPARLHDSVTFSHRSDLFRMLVIQGWTSLSNTQPPPLRRAERDAALKSLISRWSSSGTL